MGLAQIGTERLQDFVLPAADGILQFAQGLQTGGDRQGGAGLEKAALLVNQQLDFGLCHRVLPP